MAFLVRLAYGSELNFDKVKTSQGNSVLVLYNTQWGKWRQTLIPVGSAAAKAAHKFDKENGVAQQYKIEMVKGSTAADVAQALFEFEEIDTLFLIKEIRRKGIIVLESKYWITDPLLAQAHQIILENFEAQQGAAAFDIRDFTKKRDAREKEARAFREDLEAGKKLGPMEMPTEFDKDYFFKSFEEYGESDFA